MHFYIWAITGVTSAQAKINAMFMTNPIYPANLNITLLMMKPMSTDMSTDVFYVIKTNPKKAQIVFTIFRLFKPISVSKRLSIERF